MKLFYVFYRDYEKILAALPKTFPYIDGKLRQFIDWDKIQSINVKYVIKKIDSYNLICISEEPFIAYILSQHQIMSCEAEELEVDDRIAQFIKLE